MTHKKLAILIIVLILAVAAIVVAIVGKDAFIGDPSPIDAPAAVGREAQKDAQAGVYTLEVDYPTSGVGHEAVRAYFDARRAEFLGMAKENTYGMEYNLIADFETSESPKLFSYVTAVYAYTGGAHGGQDKVTFTFDKETGREVTIRELVPTQAGLEAVATLAQEKAAVALGEWADPKTIAAGAAPSYENYGWFFAGPEGVSFIFGQYHIAPYAAGITTVLLTWEELEGHIAPGMR